MLSDVEKREQLFEFNAKMRKHMKELEQRAKAFAMGMLDQNMKLQEAAVLMKDISDTAKSMKELKSFYEFLHNNLKYSKVPELMLEGGLASAKIEGVGTLSLKAGVKVDKADPEMWMEWLKENGHGDTIKESVHPMTEQALVKGLLNKGEELPSCVQVTETSSVSIRKA